MFRLNFSLWRRLNSGGLCIDFLDAQYNSAISADGLSYKDKYGEDREYHKAGSMKFDGVVDARFDHAIVIHGDFEISAKINLTVDVDSIILGDSSLTLNALKFRDLNRMYVSINSTTYVEISVSPAFPLGTPFKFKFGRVGGVGSIYVDDALVGFNNVPTDDFTVDLLGSGLSSQKMQGYMYDLKGPGFYIPGVTGDGTTIANAVDPTNPLTIINAPADFWQLNQDGSGSNYLNE